MLTHELKSEVKVLSPPAEWIEDRHHKSSTFYTLETPLDTAYGRVNSISVSIHNDDEGNPIDVFHIGFGLEYEGVPSDVGMGEYYSNKPAQVPHGVQPPNLPRPELSGSHHLTDGALEQLQPHLFELVHILKRNGYDAASKSLAKCAAVQYGDSGNRTLAERIDDLVVQAGVA